MFKGLLVKALHDKKYKDQNVNMSSQKLFGVLSITYSVKSYDYIMLTCFLLFHMLFYVFSDAHSL